MKYIFKFAKNTRGVLFEYKVSRKPTFKDLEMFKLLATLYLSEFGNLKIKKVKSVDVVVGAEEQIGSTRGTAGGKMIRTEEDFASWFPLVYKGNPPSSNLHLMFDENPWRHREITLIQSCEDSDEILRNAALTHENPVIRELAKNASWKNDC